LKILVIVFACMALTLCISIEGEGTLPRCFLT
jgi:hypothetical protein